MGREVSGDEFTKGNFTRENLSELLYKICPTFSLTIQFYA